MLAPVRADMVPGPGSNHVHPRAKAGSGNGHVDMERIGACIPLDFNVKAGGPPIPSVSIGAGTNSNTGPLSGRQTKFSL